MFSMLVVHNLISNEKKDLLVSKPVYFWIVFVFYVLISGIFIANDKIQLINAVLLFVQTLAMIVFILEVSRNEKNNDFFLKTYALLSVTYMATLILWGENYGGIITLSSKTNPNADGMIMFYGIFCFLFLLDSKKIFKSIIFVTAICLLTYAIILTGSRKSFMAAILLIVLWLIFVSRYYWYYLSLRKKVFISTIGIICSGFFIVKTMNYFETTTLYLRFTEGYRSGGDEVRIELYKKGFDYFSQNPFFGIGFNQFQTLTGMSSHSTYAEIFSTTGIIGAFLYFIPFLLIIQNLFRIYINERKTKMGGQSLLYLILVIAMLSLGAGVILFNEIPASIMLALVISFYLNKKKL